MVKLYVKQIMNKEINNKTGKVWRLEDVPQRWKKKVEAELLKE